MNTIRKMLADFYVKWATWEKTNGYEFFVMLTFIAVGFAGLFFGMFGLTVLTVLVAVYRYWIGPYLVNEQASSKNE